MWHFVHSAKNCQLENELVSVDYASKVGEKQFLDVRKSRKSRESKIKVCSSSLQDWLAHHTFQLQVYVHKVRLELNTTVDALKTRSKIVNSLRCYQVWYQYCMTAHYKWYHERWHAGSRQLFLHMLPGSLLPPLLRREPGDEANEWKG